MKRLLTFLLILPFATQAWAETTFEVGNLKYTVIEGTTNVSVSKGSTAPTGALDIPDKVTNPDNSEEYTVTSIGSQAFKGCSGLTSVTVPNSVTSIGNAVFSNCGALTSISIGNSVKNIANSAFRDCKGLTKVIINSNAITSKTYSSSSSLNNLFGNQVTEYVLGGNVTSIGNYAFNSCSGVTSIIISTGVKRISNYAFSGCSGLTLISIPEGVTSIGANAFNGCSALKSVSIPEGVTGIGTGAFNGCSALTSVTIPEGVTSIGAGAFNGCSSLTSISIPASVTSISNSVFSGCSGIAKVYINSNAIISKNYTSSSNIISLFGPQVVEYVLGEEVIAIGDYVFSGCIGLTSVTIPESVTNLGNHAFEGCIGLTSVTIPEGVTSLGNHTFEGCIGLTSVTIPEGVTSLGNHTFDGCSGLASITIPESIERIGVDVLRNCNSLHYNEFDNAFYLGNNENPYLWLIKAKTTSINSCVITEYCKFIYHFAFLDCSSLTTITVPKSVTSIGEGAFSGCSGLTTMTLPFVGDKPHTPTDTWQYPFGYVFGKDSYDGSVRVQQFFTGNEVASGGMPSANSEYFIPTNLKNVVITSSNHIPYGAFEHCQNLVSITLPNTVANIDRSAFPDCLNLTEIEIQSGNHKYVSKDGVLFNKEMTTIICYPAGKKEKEYVIPTSVTNIYDLAFSFCYHLESVSIPNSVISIGNVAFQESRLSAIAYDGTSTPTIGKNAFMGANRQVKVCVPENYSSETFGGLSVCKGLVHDNAATAPTCTETGLTEVWHCKKCGKEYKEVIPALGHLFTNYIYNNDATTEADGTETAECDHGCGTTDTRVSAGTRLPDNPTVVTPTDRNALSISVVRGAIVVNNAASDIVVYDTAGRIVERQKPQQQNVIVVSGKGVYIVRCGKDEKKVVIL